MTSIVPLSIRLMCVTGILAGLAACSPPVSGQLENVYYDYATNVANGRGHDAAKNVTDTTINHYEHIRDLALHSADLSELSLFDEICVYYLRGRFDAIALSKFTGRDVMNTLVKANLIGEDKFETFTLRDIRYTKTEARAELFKSGETTQLEMWFEKQDGKWKVSPQRFRDARGDVLERRIVQFQGDRNNVMSELLKARGFENGLTQNLRQPLQKTSS